MISQWWALIPPAVWAAGCIVRDRRTDKEYIGLSLLSLAGLGWMAYGILRNEITIWVAGAVLASAYYLKLAHLVKGTLTGTLVEEGNTRSSRE